jgi:Fe-S oxidoreductase
MNEATREILWNVPASWVPILYTLCFLAAFWTFIWFFRRAKLWRRGTDDLGMDKKGLSLLAKYLLTHKTISSDRYAGWMHLCIFWGFFILLMATTLVAIQHHFGLIFLNGARYLVFSLLSDLGGVMFAVGLGMALWRRRKGGKTRLQENSAITGIIWLLLIITLSGFLLEGSRIAVRFPAFERWSVAGYPMARCLALLGLTPESAPSLHRVLWAGHAAFAVLFFVLIPVSLMRHIWLGAYSIMRPEGHPGQWTPPARTFGVPLRLENFKKIDLLHADACLTCGRCTEVCPAEAAGKPLSPRSVVLGLRQYLNASQKEGENTEPEIATYISDKSAWSCTTCHACDEACPIGIRIVDKIAMLRRSRVLEGALDASPTEALESLAQKYNPFDKPNSARLEWAQGLNVPVAKNAEDIDLLYWVGCAGAFDPAGREITRAMIKILSHLKVSFKVLGSAERCSGDPARRLGEEELWRELAEKNISTFSHHKVKTILTQCPHCMNSFRNEYPAVGHTPHVMHHSQWLNAQIAEGKLGMSSLGKETVTFHDPCYLSRANDEIKAPREILDSLVGNNLKEMKAHGKKSFCCGGGGGQVWLDVRGTQRVENIRASHVEETKATTVATGCPFCRVMLEAGRTNLPEGQGNWRVRDLAELVSETLSAGGNA